MIYFVTVLNARWRFYKIQHFSYFTIAGKYFTIEGKHFTIEGKLFTKGETHFTIEGKCFTIEETLFTIEGKLLLCREKLLLTPSSGNFTSYIETKIILTL